ncbi:formylglycine-generating enzyme family protein [bacterium]|nr:formylglycine-generating enzyme family protein [bacterium]
MRKLILLVLLSTFSSFASDCLTDVSTSVTDDGKVEITYKLTSADPTNTFPVFSLNFTGEIAGKKPFVLKKLEGAGKTGVILGEGTYTSVWNATKDGKKKNLSNIKISVEAEEVTDEATYLCLNLKTYKMSYQNDPPDVTKNTCRTKELWLRRIEPGTFMMGSPSGELGKSGNEPQHEVTLTKAYYIGVFETTQKQFKTITGYNYSRFKGSARPVENVSYTMLRGDNRGTNWPKDHEVDERGSGYYYDKKNDRHNITVPSFFYSLRNKTGNTFLFDLPTEAQWEYACRAGTTTALNDGNNLTNSVSDGNLNKLARYWYNGGATFNKEGNSKYVGYAKVGSYLPNSWGLYDMHGNVFEWCLDWYGTLYVEPEIDPVGASSGIDCVLRGGSWRNVADYCRSAYRRRSYYDNRSYGYDYFYGFRIALVQNNDVFPVPDDQIQKDFEFEISSGTGNTLPVFEVKLYGQLADGKEYPLDEMGIIEYDGASGIVVGKGKHKLTWIPDDAYTNLVDEVKLRVEYTDVTSQAKYLVLDLPSNKMRTSISGPDISDDKCRTEELWLRRIEPGTFTMGSPKNELGRRTGESQHPVRLTKAYYIGVFEMTQKQFETIAKDNPSYYFGEMRPVEYVSYDAIRGSEKGSEWPNNRDVDKKSFLGRLRRIAGNIFDLPTEAQWEYACRAGTTTALNSGKNLSDAHECDEMAEVGRYIRNLDDGKGGYSDAHTKVGSYLPNAWGLYDMHGNVNEWCLDWYEKDIGYAAIDPVGASSGIDCVLRGGSWFYDAHDCRSAHRYLHCPSDVRGNRFGFRIALVQ